MRGATRWFSVFLIATFAGAVSAADAPTIDPTWRQRAQTEGRAAYERYVEVAKRLETVSEVTAAKHPGSSGTRPFQASTRHVRTSRAGNCMFWEETRTREGAKTPPETLLECDNEKYHFTLRKVPAGYSLFDYSPGPRKLPLTRQGGLTHQAAFSALRHALDAIAGGGNSQLKALALKTLLWDESKRLLHIGYTYAIDGSPAVVDLWVDPEHNWRVMESRVETKSGVFTDVISYGHSVEGLDFPTGFKNQSHYKGNPAPPDMDITGRVISIKVADKEPKDFLLSAFGLPEPVDLPPPPRSPRTIWFVLAAIVLVGMAFMFRYLARRRARSVTT